MPDASPPIRHAPGASGVRFLKDVSKDALFLFTSNRWATLEVERRKEVKAELTHLLHRLQKEAREDLRKDFEQGSYGDPVLPGSRTRATAALFEYLEAVAQDEGANADQAQEFLAHLVSSGLQSQEVAELLAEEARLAAAHAWAASSSASSASSVAPSGAVSPEGDAAVALPSPSYEGTPAATVEPDLIARPVSAPGSLEVGHDLCIVCQTNPRNASFVHGTTAHIACCYQCALETRRRNRNCPICRQRIELVVQNFQS
eukprot:g8850.t1